MVSISFHTFIYATALHYGYRFQFCLVVFLHSDLQLDLCYVLLFLCEIFVCHFIFHNNYAYEAFLIFFYYSVVELVPPIVHTCSYYIIFIDTVKYWVMVMLK